jgi:hypothetical protein
MDNVQTKPESNARVHVPAPPNQYNTDVYNRCYFGIFWISPAESVSWDSSVSIVTGNRLDNQGAAGVRIPVGSEVFTSPYRPDRLWGPPNLL